MSEPWLAGTSRLVADKIANVRVTANLGVVLLVAAITVVLLAWGCSDQIGLITGDGPNYLMMAKSYGHSPDNRIAAEVAATSRFPPLYPLLLAKSGAADDLALAHAITIAFFGGALAAFYAWQRACGLSRGLAVMFIMTTTAIPEIWLSALMIQSEYLYLLLSLAALALLASYESRQADGTLYGAAVAVVLAILTRTIGIALLAPLAWSMRSAAWRQRIIVAATVALPLVLWYGLHQSRDGGYLSALRVYAGGGLIDIVAQQVSALSGGFSRAMLLDPAILSPLAQAFAILGGAAAIVRTFQRRPDGFYVSIYAGLLAAWPFPGDAHRLIWPILPLMVVQPALTLQSLWKDRPLIGMRIGATISASLVFVTAIPSLVYAGQRSRDPVAASIAGSKANPIWYTPDAASARRFVSTEAALVVALRRARERVPPDACVVAIRTDWVNLYAQRRSAAPLPQGVPQADFERGLRATGCEYLFATPFVDRRYGEPMYPLARLSGKLAIVDRYAVSNPGEVDAVPMEFVLARIEP